MNEPKKSTNAKTQLGWSVDKTEISGPPWAMQQQPYAHLLDPQQASQPAARGSSPEHQHHQVQVHQDYVQQAREHQQHVAHYNQDPYTALAQHIEQQPRTNANVQPRRAKGSTPPPRPSTSKPLFNDPTKPHQYNMAAAAQSFAMVQQPTHQQQEQATVPYTPAQYQQYYAQQGQAQAAQYQQYAQQTDHAVQQAYTQAPSNPPQQMSYADAYSQAQFHQHAQQANQAVQQDYSQAAQQLADYKRQQEAYAQQQAHAQQQAMYQQQQQQYAQQVYTPEAYAQAYVQQGYTQQEQAQQGHAQAQQGYAQPAQQGYAQAQHQAYSQQGQYQGYAQQAQQQPQQQQYANPYAQQYAEQVAAYDQQQRQQQPQQQTGGALGGLGGMAAKLQKRAEKQKQKLEAALKKEGKSESSDKRESAIPGAVATADASQRRDFIKKTYKTLFFAILAFSVLLWSFMNIGPLRALLDPFVSFALGGRFNWAIVLAAFMGASIIAERWAANAKSRKMQYAGLGFYVLAEAIIFVPLLAVVEWKTASIVASGGGEPNIVRDAAFLTLAVFGMLTASVVFSKKDFSFLRSGLWMASGVALTLIALSLLFGFNLGLIFSVAMVVLAAGYILYHTSQVLAHYHPEQHVSAALELFSSMALMFWYMIRIFMRARSE